MKLLFVVLFALALCAAAASGTSRHTSLRSSLQAKRTHAQAKNIITDALKKVREAMSSVHGNWCGAFHPSQQVRKDPQARKQIKPVDAIDALCERHDDCYGEHGYWDCDCNKDLVEGMDKVADQECTDSPKKLSCFLMKKIGGWTFAHIPCRCRSSKKLVLGFAKCAPAPEAQKAHKSAKELWDVLRHSVLDDKDQAAKGKTLKEVVLEAEKQYNAAKDADKTAGDKLPLT